MKEIVVAKYVRRIGVLCWSKPNRRLNGWTHLESDGDERLDQRVRGNGTRCLSFYTLTGAV